MTVNPDDLTFTYRPFKRPLSGSYRQSNGNYLDWILRGMIRAEWESPTGRIYVAWAVEDDVMEWYVNEPQLRELAADQIAVAYEQILEGNPD